MYNTPAGTLSADVATSGTFTVTVPAPYDNGSFIGALDHRLTINGVPYVSPTGFSIAISGSTATITNRSTATWKSGSAFVLQLNQLGDAAATRQPARLADRAFLGYVRVVPIGAPAASSATAVLTATAFASATSVAPTTSAVPGAGIGGRALKIVSSNAGDTTQTITITGKDAFGVTITEAIAANGTTIVNGKKAFSTVTSIASSAALAGNLSVGTINVFGLPVPMNMLGLVIKDLTNGSTSGTGGTFVAADVTAGGPTTTSGDARGTYAPNTAPDGTNYYHVLLAAPDSLFPGYQA